MSNKLLTPTQVLREALRVLHNNLVFVKNVNKQYSQEFAVSGAKVGSTINVRKPNQYYVSKTTALQAQNTNETTVPVTLSTNYQVGLNFTQAELTLSLDDFSKRILTPAMAKLASAIDADGLAQTLNIFNQVGTPGTTPGTSGGTFANPLLNYNAPQVYLNAGMMMDNMAAPRDDNRRCVLNPSAMAQSVGGLSGLMQDAGKIGEQYRKGVLGAALGFEFAMDQNVNLLTTGAHGGTPVTSGAGQIGSSLQTTGWTANATNILNAGEVFTIAGVYSVNPENQSNTGYLQQFVVTAPCSSDPNGNVTIPIYPSIVVAGSQVANGTVNAAPASGAAITLLSGSASTSYPMNIAYHQDAFTLATADLEMPKGVDFAARETYDGVSMLIVRAYDINTAQFPCRVDVLAGWATLRPELACRITG
ncbi:MAG: P22 phage major capsid protein family protein [Syntrophorhabdales bacterium]|jgi:hypothetical protein